jgi:hypothetical protein
MSPERKSDREGQKQGRRQSVRGAFYAGPGHSTSQYLGNASQTSRERSSEVTANRSDRQPGTSHIRSMASAISTFSGERHTV